MLLKNTVNLVCWESLGIPEVNLMKIIKFLGGEVRLIRLTGTDARNAESLRSAAPAPGGLIISATILGMMSGARQGMEVRQLLGSVSAKVLVYGFEPMLGDSQLLRALTSNSLVDVKPSPTGGCKINVARDSSNVCGQFSGLDFDAIGADVQLTFVAGERQMNYSPLIALERQPFFVHLRDECSQVLLLAGKEIADLDAAVSRDVSILQFFSSLAPVLMFLRFSAGNAFWHNKVADACFIVDDPLLKRRYGFLDYQKLLEVMECRRFCTSIGFIPWNFSRSDRELADLFAAHPHRYSVCVHGCDHTRGEFGTTDSLLLREKAQQALERMILHRKLSGVAFDDVMIFPQGVFSTVAMKELKACGYLAAVNSTPYPVDDDESLALSDLVQVAITRFSNFPLFTRRYPHHLGELAFDLFLGKPALVVEHHGFFRDGYDALAELVQKLYGLDERLQWTSPATACSRARLERVAENGDVHVLFFTGRFSLRNQTDRPQRYVLFRKALPEEGVKGVTINGRQVDIGYEADHVKAQVTLEAGQAAEVKVEYGQAEAVGVSRRQDRLYQAKVFIRRSLSEFRDNYVDRSRLLSRSIRARSVPKMQTLSRGS